MSDKKPVYILPDDEPVKPKALPIIIETNPPAPPLHRYTCYICGAWVLTEPEITAHFKTHWLKVDEGHE